jgi:hypothetical protein
LPDSLNRAGVGIFVRINISLSVVELLHYLNIITLTFAYDSAARVLLYFFLKPTIIPTCAIMMNAKKFDPWGVALIGLANNHGKPLPKRKTL